MTNPRKNKKNCTIWLSETEVKILKEYLEINNICSIGIMVKEASERGDLKI